MRRLFLTLVVALGACIESTQPTVLPGGGGGGGSGAPGSVQVNVTTTGANPDPNGYQVVLNEATSQAVDPNGSATFVGLQPGSYQVTLFGLDGTCAVQGSGPSKSFTISSGSVTSVDFAIECP